MIKEILGDYWIIFAVFFIPLSLYYGGRYFGYKAGYRKAQKQISARYAGHQWPPRSGETSAPHSPSNPPGQHYSLNNASHDRYGDLSIKRAPGPRDWEPGS